MHYREEPFSLVTSDQERSKLQTYIALEGT